MSKCDTKIKNYYCRTKCPARFSFLFFLQLCQISIFWNQTLLMFPNLCKLPVVKKSARDDE